MIPTSSATASSITWSKVPRSRTYEFKRDQQIVGTLQRPSIWTPTAHAETPDNHWIIRRAGILGSGAEIVDSTTRQVIATFKAPWGGPGTLTFSDGTDYRLSSKGFWHPVWTLRQSEQAVLTIHARERSAEINQCSAISQSRILLLTMFTLYRVQQAEEEAAAVVFIAAS